jgi:hypothetical protein
MLTETTRTRAIMAIMLLALMGAIVAIATAASVPIQALLFCAMAATAAIISSLLVVAVD